MSVLENQNDTSVRKNLFRNKAVSDGAISFYLDHYVRTRVSKVTFGFFCEVVYDPTALDHISRSHRVVPSNIGEAIQDYFAIILPKVSFLISFLKIMS